MNYSNGTKGFFEWLKDKQPELYARVAQGFQSPQNGVGDVAIAEDPATASSTTPMSSGVMSSISNLVNVAAQAYLTKSQMDAQKSLLDVQLQRAAQGLPPLNINPSQYGLTPQIGVGLSPQTQSLVMWGGIALLAALVLPKLLGGRK